MAAVAAPMKIALPCAAERFSAPAGARASSDELMKVALPCMETHELAEANEQLAAANLRLQRSNELLRLKAELVAENARLKREVEGESLEELEVESSGHLVGGGTGLDAQAAEFIPQDCSSTCYVADCGYSTDCGYGVWQMDANCGYGAGMAYGYGDMDLESTVAGSFRDRSFSSGTDRESILRDRSFSAGTERESLLGFPTQLLAAAREEDDDAEVIEVLEEDELEVLERPPPGLRGVETKTTMMMRNFPNSFQRSTLETLLDAQGFAGTYNLIYAPTDFSTSASFGYAFINFVSTSEAMRFQAHFHGFDAWECSESQKICDVAWSDGKQGFQAHVERYKNSPVMHESVPDQYKPAVYCNGVRLPFAQPTKAIKAPRFRKRE